MKTAISIADPLFEAAERLARELGMSRSQLYSTAVETYIAAHRHDEITKRLDDVYSKQPSRIDRALLDAQLASVTDEDW